MPGVRIPSLRPNWNPHDCWKTQCSCGFLGFLGPIFQNRPTVDVQPPKGQKQQKNRFLIFIREAVFSFFRHRQRNDFRRPVRDVLGFDRGRRCFRETGKYYRFTKRNTRSIIENKGNVCLFFCEAFLWKESFYTATATVSMLLWNVCIIRKSERNQWR